MKYILSKVKSYFIKLDKLLVMTCTLICAFAVFMLYTLNENGISGSVTESQYKTQLAACAAGLFAALIIAAVDYRLIAKLWFIYVIEVIVYDIFFSKLYYIPYHIFFQAK